MTHVFQRGSLALDFIGTVASRRSARPVDRIATPRDFAEWLCEAGLIRERAGVSERQRARALVLREAMARIADAFVAKETPSRGDLAILNSFARETKLGATTLGAKLEVQRETRAPISFALGAIASDAVRLFSTHRDRLARCELPDCGGIILTGDRGERRRWCSMERCGNRAKVAALRMRRSEGAARIAHQ